MINTNHSRFGFGLSGEGVSGRKQNTRMEDEPSASLYLGVMHKIFGAHYFYQFLHNFLKIGNTRLNMHHVSKM
jgi:hypothetical protein